MLSNHLSETASQDQPVNEDALTQLFDLPPDEQIIGLFKATFPDDYLKSRTTQPARVERTKGHDSDTEKDIECRVDRRKEQSSGEGEPQSGEGEGREGACVPEELMKKIETHSVLDGCVLITDAAIYQCRPR